MRFSSTGRLLGLGLRCMSAANKLHGGQGAQEEHRGDAECMHRQPPDREDRVVAGRGGGGGLGHGLFQALVEGGLGVVTLAHDGGLGVVGLEVGIRAGRAEGVVGQAGGYEKETRQEQGRQGHGVDHPITDARDDFKERAFTR